mmetsp:Transcript_59478/g.94460  ORF Transcript_59478/g.94460 Transcript_59478/m.94460 type:complete len:116 (-) Transcript_59478:70-417(-)
MNGSVARGAPPIAPLPPGAAEEETVELPVGAQAQHPLVDVIVSVTEVSLVVVSDVAPDVVDDSTVVVDEATAVSQAQQSAAATADVDVNDDEDDELDVAKVDPMQANDTSASIIF